MLTLCALFWDGGQSTKTIREWCKIVRENEKKTRQFFHFLDEKKIANVEVLDNQKITITCRRMKRDLEIRKVRQEAGKRGGNPSLIKSDPNLLNQNDKQKPTLSVSVPVPVPNLKPKHTPIEIPKWIKQETWDDFVAMRKAKKEPLMDVSIKRIIAKLDRLRKSGQDPNEILDESISNGWKGVFPLKTGGDNVGRGTGNRSAGPGTPIQAEYVGEIQAPISEAERISNLRRVRELMGQGSGEADVPARIAGGA
jgi:hypothetical protein